VTPALSCSSDGVWITCSITNSAGYLTGATPSWQVDGGAFPGGLWSISIPDDLGIHTFSAFVSATGFVDSSVGSATFP
jgi:hypothetical protein